MSIMRHPTNVLSMDGARAWGGVQLQGVLSIPVFAGLQLQVRQYSVLHILRRACNLQAFNLWCKSFAVHYSVHVHIRTCSIHDHMYYFSISCILRKPDS